MSENEVATRPAPQQLVVDHPAWREALGQVRAAVSRPHAVVAILGSAGTGKTLLLRALLGELRAEGRDAVLLQRGDAEAQLVTRPGVVLVDEADRISPEALATLVGSGAQGIVLAALPAFAERLDAVIGATRVKLRPLRPEEAADFLHARVEPMGVPGWLTDDATSEIVASGRGIPRLLVALLTATDFVASLQAAPHVTAEHVREAVSLRGGLEAAVEETVDAPEPPDPPPSPAEPAEKAGNSVHSPDPGERWTESALPSPATPAPAQRRRSGLWAIIACTVAAALLAAYAASQPNWGRLGQRVAVLRLNLSAPPPGSPASAGPALAVAVEPSQAMDAAPSAPNQAPTPPAAALPQGVVPHVVLSYPQGDADAEWRGFEVARKLRAAGVAASDPVPVLHAIAEPGIAYFFAEDQAGANEVSRVLGSTFGEGRATALRQDEPLPRPGTIEVEIPSEQPEIAEQAR